MTDPLHTEPVEVTQLRVASDRCYPGLHYIEGAPFRISFWTIATNIDPVEGVRRLRFADELVAAWNTRTAAEAASRAREDALVSLLTKAVGDIAAALEAAGSAGLIRKWTADYVAAINAHDARAALNPAAKGGE